ncbi:MAG: NYN domain-containing protein [Nitrospirota bacterium]
MTKDEVQNIALLVDFENFSANPSDIFEVEKLYRMLNLPNNARLILKRAYGDWGQYAKYKNELRTNSFELIEMPIISGKGKNSSDIQLTVDALEIALTKDYVDTFIIVTGDSDFAPLLSKLRTYNKFTIVVGKDKYTSKILGNFSDEIIYYSNLTSEELEVTEITNAYKLLKDAVVEIQNENKLPLGSFVKLKIKQINPSFSETEYGFSQWRLFLEKAREDGVVELEKHEKGDFLVGLPKEVEIKDADFTNTFYSNLYKAIEQSKGKDNKSLFSQINDKLQKIDSSFNIKNYGISKTKGFSAFMRLLSEKGLVQIFRTGHTYSSTATEKLKKLAETKTIK